MTECDYAIIGSGIVGAAVAYRLSQRQPQAKIRIFDKEPHCAAHQTGRNSGVIHAGVYYTPGSYKARFCRAGLAATVNLCQQHNIAYEQCGKLIVATSADELAAMHALYERCVQNELNPVMLSREQIAQREPAISAVGGFLVKQTGITDYADITRCLLSLASTAKNCRVLYQHQLQALEETSSGVYLSIKTPDGHRRVHAAKVINCAGIYSDEIIRRQGLECDFRMLPFKGEYYKLVAKYNHVSRHLIYPVPDPAMPFLGVHLTRMIGGYTTVGPNAVLTTGREAYGSLLSRDAEWLTVFGHADVWKLLWRYRKSAVHELRSSLSKVHYARLVSRYCPGITAQDFLPYRAGIRAQAVDRQGNLIHDFKFVESAHTLHVGNAPSPAATSALPIADEILSRLF
ncbi:L-2-hydroxyglutarate oxidase [Alteromonas gilva]|uniref:L-2-hydroxyglutarate oxidase n=1 Tax=Alteromonas gilva TaxID=2987522 RepID=A0ABT5L241_9ALTE|nr:L-2-hydroxyglutarate oxidase [Alteromonas gilva]MDC8830942.1 L-2-hydroxyglutarate oxidase [Alteromonas gilva]